MSKYKIWFQGATDRVHMAPYITKVEGHLKAILDADFSATFHSTTPPATTTHAITEFRIARALIKNAVEAERQGYAAMVADFIDAFASEDAKRKLAPKWERECRVLLDAGADVIVPAGGLPMMLFGMERGANIDGAPIVNGVTLAAKTAELAVRMREQA